MEHDGAVATLVIGLGNPILGDDGVGWHIAEAVQAAVGADADGVEIDCLAVGGLRLMERMVGYDRVVLADAMSTGQSPPGTVTAFPLEAMPERAATHCHSAHDASLPAAMDVGRAMGARLPAEVFIVAVEADCVYEFSEGLSGAISAAVPRAAAIVLAHLRGEA